MAFHANVEDCLGSGLDLDAAMRAHPYVGNGTLHELDDLSRTIIADASWAALARRLRVPFGLYRQRKAS
jgi:hypothetical protein